MSLLSARRAADEDDDIEAELQRALDAMESLPACDIEDDAESAAQTSSTPRRRDGGSVPTSTSAWTNTGAHGCVSHMCCIIFAK